MDPGKNTKGKRFFQELFCPYTDAMPTPELMRKAPEEGVSDPAGESTKVTAPLFLCAYHLEAGSSSVLHPAGGCGLTFSSFYQVYVHATQRPMQLPKPVTWVGEEAKSPSIRC